MTMSWSWQWSWLVFLWIVVVDDWFPVLVVGQQGTDQEKMLGTMTLPIVQRKNASWTSHENGTVSDPKSGGIDNDQDNHINFEFDSWDPCGRASFDFMDLTPQQDVHPCILYDIRPPTQNTESSSSSRSYLVTLVQVTPAASSCYSMRDGAVVSVELLNAQNDGRGVAVGFYKDFYIQFRLVSIVAGNGDYISTDHYGARHACVLQSALTALQPQYIIGTCSFFSKPEAPVAEQHQTMLMAQVGPPSYYQTGNPYVFGMHLNSDNYPLPAVRALGFASLDRHQPVRVLYRTVAEFFYSTCRSAVDALHALGFTNVLELEYVPDDDHDGDGIQNQFDVEFMQGLADQACPPMNHTDDDNNLQQQHSEPAIFACFLSEQDIVLPRLVQNGCRPTSIWLTAATWGWGTANPEQIPFMQGGGQWHESFTYDDGYYASGQDLLRQSEARFSYLGTYDFVVSYSIPMLFAEHLKATYRVTDHPDPATDFGTPAGYEMLRRSMVILDAKTLFGPVSFDDNQRNIGRAPAGTQWLTNVTLKKERQSMNETLTPQAPPQTEEEAQQQSYNNYLVSPEFMAQAPIEVPAPSALDCPPGQFFNESMAMSSSSLLTKKCSQCPQDSFTYESNHLLECLPCPNASTTQGRTGETMCYYDEENLIPTSVRSFGYSMVGITWALALIFMAWLLRWRHDAVVQIAQLAFMTLICVGATISSSAIIALSWQAGVDEDTTAATTACRVAPFLYCTGWVLQYGSLTAKTFRLYKITRRQSYERRTVTALETSWIIALILALDLGVVIVWTIVAPLEYRRETTSVAINGHVVTTSSYGRCAPPDSTSIWAFAGPLAAIHLTLMVVTNWLLYKISDLEDRYQEQKFVALASMYVFQVLVIGLPVLFSVGDSTAAIFLVLTGIIALNDVGILCFLFLPKVYFRRQGLTEGVGIGESIRRSTFRKAQMRELSRQSGGGLDESALSNISHHSSRSYASYARQGSNQDCRLSIGSTVVESMLDPADGERRSNRSSNRKSRLDSDNIDELKFAILQERCDFLEQENRDLMREVEFLRGQGNGLPEEGAALLNTSDDPKEEVADDAESMGSFSEA